MIRIFYEENNNLIEAMDIDIDIQNIRKGSWIHITSPDTPLVAEICEVTGLDKERTIASLDPEEAAHVDFYGDNLITLDIPYWNGDICETVPFIIMYNDSYFLTMCNKETSLVDLVLKNKRVEPHKGNRLAIQIMYRITSIYIQALRRIDVMTNTLEEKIKSSTKNKEILELMDINKSLIYLSISLNSNKNAFVKLLKIDEFNMYDSDKDLMDDVIIENNQAIEMCQIHREILDNMLNAFASITSNNLNIIMKLLAIITLVLALPTLISSIYGMNVEGLPFHSMRNAFWIILAISALTAVVGSVILILCTNYAVKRKKAK